MEFGKPSIVSWLAWAAIAGIGIYLVYAATHTNIDTENYGKGSSKVEYTISENNIMPRCGQMFTFLENGTPVKVKK